MRRRSMRNSIRGGVVTATYVGNNTRTLIINKEKVSGSIKMYIDGQEESPISYYDFGDAKEHEVIFEFDKDQPYMDSLFSFSIALNSIDLSRFNTLYMTSMRNMFYGCTSLKYLKITRSINKVSDATRMFFQISTTGTFEYNQAHDYSKIIEQLPSTWTAKPI